MAAAACLVTIFLGRAWAEAPDTVLLEELTWTELRDLTASRSIIIIVPVGGTEQNGPHMTLGKHNVRVKVLSEKIARVARQCAGGPGDRVRAGRTGSARPRVTCAFRGRSPFRTRPSRRCSSTRREASSSTGSRTSSFSATTDRTQADQKAVAARLNREWAGTPARVHAIDEYYRAADVEFPRLLKARGYREEELGLPCRARRHLADAGRGSAHGAVRRAATGPPETERRVRRSEPGQRRARPARRGADRVADRRGDQGSRSLVADRCPSCSILITSRTRGCRC